jgi:uncharacterized membrane protein YhaH (DUF805 family)
VAIVGRYDARMDTTAPPPQSRDDDDLRWLLFAFDGRIGRQRWWLWGVAAMLGLVIYFTAVLRIAGASPSVAEGLVNILLVWPALAISAKRWHDRGKSAWWVLLMLIPVIGWLWTLIECGMLKGTPGANRFGDAPRA